MPRFADLVPNAPPSLIVIPALSQRGKSTLKFLHFFDILRLLLLEIAMSAAVTPGSCINFEILPPTVPPCPFFERQIVRKLEAVVLAGLGVATAAMLWTIRPIVRGSLLLPTALILGAFVLARLAPSTKDHGFLRDERKKLKDLIEQKHLGLRELRVQHPFGYLSAEEINFLIKKELKEASSPMLFKAFDERHDFLAIADCLDDETQDLLRPLYATYAKTLPSDLKTLLESPYSKKFRRLLTSTEILQGLIYSRMEVLEEQLSFEDFLRHYTTDALPYTVGSTKMQNKLAAYVNETKPSPRSKLLAVFHVKNNVSLYLNFVTHPQRVLIDAAHLPGQLLETVQKHRMEIMQHNEEKRAHESDLTTQFANYTQLVEERSVLEKEANNSSAVFQTKEAQYKQQKDAYTEAYNNANDAEERYLQLQYETTNWDLALLQKEIDAILQHQAESNQLNHAATQHIDKLRHQRDQLIRLTVELAEVERELTPTYHNLLFEETTTLTEKEQADTKKIEELCKTINSSLSHAEEQMRKEAVTQKIKIQQALSVLEEQTVEAFDAKIMAAQLALPKDVDSGPLKEAQRKIARIELCAKLKQEWDQHYKLQSSIQSQSLSGDVKALRESNKILREKLKVAIEKEAQAWKAYEQLKESTPKFQQLIADSKQVFVQALG